jgi:hypothetical protein
MQELLQQIDLDFYRSARLLIVRAELAHLRQGPPSAGFERQSKTALGGTSSLAESGRTSLPIDR